MADISRGGRIADPVHGYVDFTGIERAILGHRVAQRLQYVSQNGLAHLVFPEARTSRFSHSLGAMHLASEFFAASLRNADRETRRQVGEAVSNAVRQVAGRVADPDRAAKGFATEALVAQNYCLPDHQPCVLLAEQGLRLAALFHDLGHLPFSHDFEAGLEEFWHELPDKEGSPLKKLLQQRPGQAKIHERLGHRLALLLLKDLFAEMEGTPQGEAARISFEFAQRILESLPAPNPKAEEAAVQWLHTLIDGELDVDRCDFILRDARNHGFEFATYDLVRLLDNLIVASSDRSFALAVRPHGLSAVESFLLSRFRSYQYGMRHHKVAQVGAALRYSIGQILGAARQETVRRFIEDLGAIADAESVRRRAALLKRFAQYDDIWWMGIMREYSQTEPDEWLDLICWRQPGPISLWKRVGDFPRQLKEWNEGLPDFADDDAQARWWQEVVALRQEGVLVIRHDFCPWQADGDSGESILCIQQNRGNMVPVSRLSPLVRALRDAWMNDIQVQAFAKSDSHFAKLDRVVAAQEVLARLPAAQGG